MNDDICIVSVGVDGRDSYARQASYVKSKVDELGYPNYIWIGTYPPESPSHQEVNFAFKYYAIEYARSMGYKKILWLDSVVIPIKPKLDKINSILDNNGYFFVRNGHEVGSWCKDEALPYLGITREEAFNISQVAGGYFALNFSSKESIDFFDQYKTFATKYGKQVLHGDVTNINNSVSTDNRVKGHRHDQIVSSVILSKLNLTIPDSGYAICYQNNENWKSNLIDKNEVELLVL